MSITMIVVEALSHVTILIGSLILLRKMRSVWAGMMLVACGLNLLIQLVALASFIDLISNTWAQYLLIGLPAIAFQAVWLLFGLALIGVAVSHKCGGDCLDIRKPYRYYYCNTLETSMRIPCKL